MLPLLYRNPCIGFLASAIVMQPKDSSEKFARWMLFFIAVAALACSGILRWKPELLSQGGLAVSELSGRIGLVLLCGWFAWPTFRHVRSSPGGFIVMVISFVAAILFICRPKSALLIVPIAILAGAIVSLLGWFRKFK